MKRMLFSLLVLTSVLITTATTCKNPYVTELLKQPSELNTIEVTAYVGELQLMGGASFEPGFTPSVRDYVVYIPKEADRFTVNAVFDGNGTVKCLNISMDGDTDPEVLDFVFLEDEDSLEVVLTVEREFMSPGEYSVTVSRLGSVPPPKDIAVTITPLVGSYFLNRGVRPVLRVTAEKPEEASVLSYQWYRNEENNNATGTPIAGANGTSYALSGADLTREGTTYFYAEVTNTFEGKRSAAPSLTRAVTFFNKERALSDPSRAMVNVSDRFFLSRSPVAYELFEFVRKRAELEDYQFANMGLSLSYYDNNIDSSPALTFDTTVVYKICWRDAVVWCNAYSEMDGKQPVYLDSAGNVLLDSRDKIEDLIDDFEMAGKNGYRLPTMTEWNNNTLNALYNSGYVNFSQLLFDKHTTPDTTFEGDKWYRMCLDHHGSVVGAGVLPEEPFFSLGRYALGFRVVCTP